MRLQEPARDQGGGDGSEPMPERCRLLLALPYLGPGGAQRVLVSIMRGLDQRRFEVRLVVPNRVGDVYSHLIPPQVELIDLRKRRVRDALPALLRLIWDYRPDVVFATVEHMIFWLAATCPFWPRETRFVARPTLMLSALLRDAPNARLRRMLAHVTLRNADILVFQSRQMEEDWRSTLSSRHGKSIVIPNPIDFSELRERAQGPVLDPTWDHNAFNLIAAGRLERQKGFDLAIEAFGRVADANMRLSILGEGSSRPELERQIYLSGLQDRVKLLGYAGNPFPYYAAADGLLISSRYEGFPNAALEALACGTPVIAVPVPGLSDVILEVPACVLARDTTVNGLAGAIQEFFDRGRARVDPIVVTSFDADRITALYEAVFDERRT